MEEIGPEVGVLIPGNKEDISLLRGKFIVGQEVVL